jgi:hypothetical protein
MKRLTSRKYTNKPFDLADQYPKRKRMYYNALDKANKFDSNNPYFTGDFDDIVEGVQLWYALRYLKGRF